MLIYLYFISNLYSMSNIVLAFTDTYLMAPPNMYMAPALGITTRTAVTKISQVFTVTVLTRGTTMAVAACATVMTQTALAGVTTCATVMTQTAQGAAATYAIITIPTVRGAATICVIRLRPSTAAVTVAWQRAATLWGLLTRNS